MTAEFTKGELAVIDTNQHGDYYIGNRDNQKYIAIVVPDILNTKNIAEANAAELVRRWNAFEDGGLVTDLLAACKLGVAPWSLKRYAEKSKDLSEKPNLAVYRVVLGNIAGMFEILEKEAENREAAITEV